MLPPLPRFIPPLGPPKKSRRQKILAQWRGFDVDVLEKGERLRALPVSALMPKVLSGLRIDKRRAEAEIVKVWNNLLDPNIVAHAQPTGLRKGTLFVAVDSSTWLSEIVRYRRKEILTRLQHSFGVGIVTRISFRLG
jgi:predicted nucleic acid-binding Zn ribbon protein